MLNKMQFAKLVTFVGGMCGHSLSEDELYKLDELTTPQLVTSISGRPTVAEVDVDDLMGRMNAKTNKIDAIKAYRQITNAGLKEAKDAVEKYW